MFKGMMGCGRIRDYLRGVLIAGVLAGVAGLGGVIVPRARAACTTFGPGEVWGKVVIDNLKEASGLAASRRNPGVLWTHNDGSRKNFFALSMNGARLATFTLDAEVDDVEDMAAGPGPAQGMSYLYIGDIGASKESSATRSATRVIRVPEPEVDPAWAARPRSLDFTGAETFTLVYPEGSYDAESLMVDPISGDVFVVTKQEGLARIYRADLARADASSVVNIEFVRQVSFGLASAGDISDDGTQIVLRREGFAMMWERRGAESVGEALARQGIEIPVIGPPEEPNGESLALLPGGAGYVTISEGEYPALYYFPPLCPLPAEFVLSPSNVSVFAGGSAVFTALAAGYPRPTYFWMLNGAWLSVGTNATLSLSHVTPAQSGVCSAIASNIHGLATNQAMLTVRPKPDLRVTEVMSAPAAGASVTTADWWELTNFEDQPVDLTGWRFNDGDGGLADAYVFEDTLSIGPGESIVLVEDLSAAKFRKWWGATNLPTGLQIVSYKGNGLSLGVEGDTLRLWSDIAMDTNETIATASFRAATEGISYDYDPATGVFGGLSQLGVNGVFRAVSTPDIGSPGWVRSVVIPPQLRVMLTAGRIRLEFDARAGRRYALEACDVLDAGAWAPTGDTCRATNDTLMSFTRAISDVRRFYRLEEE